MRTLLLGTAVIVGVAWLTSCAYSGPRVDLNIGFMGASVGVAIGGQPPQAIPVALPVTKGFAK